MRDGVEHEIDTLILATGFTPAELPHRGADPRTRRPLARGGLGRQPAGVSGHDRHRLPEPPLPLRTQPEPGPHVDRLHARVAARLRDRRAAHDATARRGRVRGSRRRSRPPTTRSSRSGSPGPRLEHRAAAAGTSTATAATRSVARLHLRVPPPHAPLRRPGVPPRPATTLSAANGASRSHPPLTPVAPPTRRSRSARSAASSRSASRSPAATATARRGGGYRAAPRRQRSPHPVSRKKKRRRRG